MNSGIAESRREWCNQSICTNGVNYVHPNVVDITDQRHGRLTVQQYCGRGRWQCLCDCGSIHIVTTSNLRHTRSCGCLAKELRTTHGESDSPAYISWRGMLDRCRNPRHKSWKTYGGRGVRVCVRWCNSNGFKNFLQDMGPRPKGTTIERRDPSRGYAPKNCFWATRKVQNRNTTQNRNITLDGRTQCLADWATELGVRRELIRDRIDRLGWSERDAITTPPRPLVRKLR